jgi:hypothetical protein
VLGASGTRTQELSRCNSNALAIALTEASRSR